MLYNQTYNLDQVQFAAEGIKDAQQTVCSISLVFFVILALNSFHISICITSLFVQEYEDGLIHNRRHNVFFFYLLNQIICDITSSFPV
jgi:hypothetical protein